MPVKVRYSYFEVIKCILCYLYSLIMFKEVNRSILAGLYWNRIALSFF